MATLLFEIGTEEMPARAAREALGQMKKRAAVLLEEYRLSEVGAPDKIIALGTPRRLVIIVDDLPANQRSAVEDVKGPPARAAFDEDGAPKPAALGFAKSQGVAVDDLTVRQESGGEYVYARRELSGDPAETVLGEILRRLALSLEFTKPMRWGSGTLRFIRPIRWLTAMLGKAVIPLELDGVVSGRITYGHRFTDDGPIELADAADYRKALAGAKVVLDQDSRRQAIVKMVEKAASDAGGLALNEKGDQKVLDEVVFLVEDPHVVVGEYERDFLNIPRVALVTAMQSHQRYFPIEDESGDLMPRFAVVHNGDPEFGDQIRLGHQRVLRARLADAAFFFNEDIKTTLESKNERLKGVVWQRRLGTVLEKVERTRTLGARLADLIGSDAELKALIDRALALAKADLTTAMVVEFPDLQGEIGREYALVDGENNLVAAAVSEHYLPRYAGDELPSTEVGQVAALSDKIDTLSGCFMIGLAPTGSADPYALRRQAAGVIQILAQTKWPFAILDLIELGIDSYKETKVDMAERERVAPKLREFLIARLRRWLVDSGSTPEAVEAVLSAGHDRVDEIASRVKLLDEARDQSEMEDIKVAFTRCQNLSNAEYGQNVDEDLFEDDAESNLFAECARAEKEMDQILARGALPETIGVLASLRRPIDRFFDEVLVMAPDEKVKMNRLKLLNLCVSVSRQVADFSQLPS